MAEFKGWPSISRLARDVTVTEKIDGSSGAIHIERLKFVEGKAEVSQGDVVEFTDGELTFLRVTAQSRSRLISVREDNFGFARWVADNASGLVATLGEGIHYGEWWGYKIQRGYGLPKGDRRFSLFNTERWGHLAEESTVPGLTVVPVLASGLLWTPKDDFYYEDPVDDAIEHLKMHGSAAAPGYMRPEGIVVFHTTGRVMFKYTLDGDGHKSEKKVDPFADIRQNPQPKSREQQILELEGQDALDDYLKHTDEIDKSVKAAQAKGFDERINVLPSAWDCWPA